MSTSPATTAERQRDYRARLESAGKTNMRLVVSKDVARQLHDLSRQHVAPIDIVLAKALDALVGTEPLEIPHIPVSPALDAPPPSPRKQARLERRVDDAMEAVKAGEHRLRYGPPVVRKRRGAR